MESNDKEHAAKDEPAMPDERGESIAMTRSLMRLKSANHDCVAPPKKSANPVMAFLLWWASWAVPGLGMFSEAYMIFAIGNIKPLLKIQYPNCIGLEEPMTCSESTVDSIEYVEICGIIFGMLALGLAGDIIGRKWGSRLTMTIMFVGAVLLTGAYGSTDSQFLAVFLFSLAFYGVGVGGEYPMASSSAAERAEGCPEMRKRRGEVVVLVFSQQGWGNWANTLVVLILMAMVGATATVDSHQAEVVWRVQFAIGAFICFCTMLYRWIYLEESEVWSAEKEDMEELDLELEAKKGLMRRPSQVVCSGSMRNLKHENYRRRFQEYKALARFYWPRLFITCMGWIANDFAFYGNKLFISQFIAIISPGASQYKKIQWTLLNSSVALVGYYFAAYTIDKSWWGRRRMQNFGFFMMAVLFFLCAGLYNTLLEDAIQAFQFLYFMTSFFNQFGPNCTTWLVAGEVFPTDVRAFFHGISAAFGKAGAAAASATFTQISDRDTFYASAIAGLAGLVLTIIFLPDTTGLDLAEIDRMNKYMVAGQLEHYHGEALAPKYLSLFERWMGYGKHYDPEKDRKHRLVQGLE